MKDPNTSPWVISYSGIGQNTEELIRKRAMEDKSSIFLYIFTSVMLFGLDVKDISMVILSSPFNSLNSLVQAGGRTGRMEGNGMRKKAVIYALYNTTDIRQKSFMEKNF